jgi:hypothetical protein
MPLTMLPREPLAPVELALTEMPLAPEAVGDVAPVVVPAPEAPMVAGLVDGVPTPTRMGKWCDVVTGVVAPADPAVPPLAPTDPEVVTGVVVPVH